MKRRIVVTIEDHEDIEFTEVDLVQFKQMAENDLVDYDVDVLGVTVEDVEDEEVPEGSSDR